MIGKHLGILGGTFDPIHNGHLDLARAAEAALQLDEVVIIPTRIPPHRPAPQASAYHRFAMAALAIQQHPTWRASDLELRRRAPSYTVTTLAHLQADGHDPDDLFFTVGADAFLEIETWKDYPAILDRAHFAVVSRAGHPATALATRLPALAPRMRTPTAPTTRAESDRRAIFLIDAPTADVSSTIVRSRAAAGLPLAGLVPAAVADHIERHHLYVRERTGDNPATGANRAPGGFATGRRHGHD